MLSSNNAVGGALAVGMLAIVAVAPVQVNAGAVDFDAAGNIVGVLPEQNYRTNGSFTGVVPLTFTGGGTGGLCSGSLLRGRKHILTAAHCMTGTSGEFDRNNVSIEIGGSTVNVPINETTTFIPSSWQGDDLGANGFFAGSDIAVIELPQAITDPGVEAYDIYRGTTESLIGEIFEIVGFGRRGTGEDGSVSGTFGTQRAGQNSFDLTGELFFDLTNLAGTGFSQLYYDFDNRLEANDAIYTLLDNTFLVSPELADEASDSINLDNTLGLGDNEVTAAPGDSGGPLFVNGRIAGITSYGLSFNESSPLFTDIDDVLNNSFGEFSVATDVTVFAGFLNEFVVIPVPPLAGLLGLSCMALIGLRRRV